MLRRIARGRVTRGELGKRGNLKMGLWLLVLQKSPQNKTPPREDCARNGNGP